MKEKYKMFCRILEGESSEEEKKWLKNNDSILYDLANSEESYIKENFNQFADDIKESILEVKTNYDCDECGSTFYRYKYMPFNELKQRNICDDCIKKMALDYSLLSEIEDELKEIEDKTNNLLNLDFNSCIFKEIKNIEDKKFYYGKCLSDFSNNNAMNLNVLEDEIYDEAGDLKRIKVYYNEQNGMLRISTIGDEVKVIDDIYQLHKIAENRSVIYDNDCKNIELRYQEFLKRDYDLIKSQKGYIWIQPKGFCFTDGLQYGGEIKLKKVKK